MSSLRRGASLRLEWTRRLPLLSALSALPLAGCASVLGTDGLSFGDAGVDAVGQDGTAPTDSAVPMDASDGGREALADGPARESSVAKDAANEADAPQDAANEADAAEDAASLCATCVAAGWACGAGATCTYAPNGSGEGPFQLVCPADFTCVITCTFPDECVGTCSGSSCTFNCTGGSACDGITCDASSCNINCLPDSSACVGITCNASGPCCVSCPGCANGTDTICTASSDCELQSGPCT
jgi:hypothetical protein